MLVAVFVLFTRRLKSFCNSYDCICDCRCGCGGCNIDAFVTPKSTQSAFCNVGIFDVLVACLLSNDSGGSGSGSGGGGDNFSI